MAQSTVNSSNTFRINYDLLIRPFFQESGQDDFNERMMN